MKILFDQGTPVPLRAHPAPHSVTTAAERNWSQLTNGDFLAAAENDGFEVMITTDQNLRYQQNLSGRKLAIVVLKTTSWPRIRTKIEEISACLDSLSQTASVEIDF